MDRNLKFVLILMLASCLSLPCQIVQADDEDDTWEEVENFDVDDDGGQNQNQAPASQEETSIQSITVPYDPLIPFIRYVNYKYHGDGSLFNELDIIMEYPPDENGIFQISAFSGQQAEAYVFQIRSTGMYELARFNDYNEVQDLRYSQEAMSQEEALILPSQLTIGTSFQSGYSNERTFVVESLIESMTIGNSTYHQVIKLSEAQGDGSYHYYYLAPSYGLIIVEKMDPAGNIQTLAQLVGTDGNLIQ